MNARIGKSWVLLVAAAAMASANAHAQSFILPGTAPPPSEPALGAPRVHIESNFPITLHRSSVSFFGEQREIACQTPCDTIVDGRQGESFYFAGDEIPKSRPFRLIEKSGEVIAHVSAGNRTALKVGNGLLVPSMLTLAAGTALLPFDLLTKDPGTASQLQTATYVILGIGVAALVTSIALIVSGRTRFDFENRVGPNGVRF